MIGLIFLQNFFAENPNRLSRQGIRLPAVRLPPVTGEIFIEPFIYSVMSVKKIRFFMLTDDNFIMNKHNLCFIISLHGN